MVVEKEGEIRLVYLIPRIGSRTSEGSGGPSLSFLSTSNRLPSHLSLLLPDPYPLKSSYARFLLSSPTGHFSFYLVPGRETSFPPREGP